MSNEQRVTGNDQWFSFLIKMLFTFVYDRKNENIVHYSLFVTHYSFLITEYKHPISEALSRTFSIESLRMQLISSPVTSNKNLLFPNKPPPRHEYAYVKSTTQNTPMTICVHFTKKTAFYHKILSPMKYSIDVSMYIWHMHLIYL